MSPTRARVAEALRGDPRVAWVEYAGLSPIIATMRWRNKYLGGRPPSLLTFGVRGGHAAAKRFYDALKLIKRVVNIGDTRTLCCHPASTTHRQMTPEQQLAGRRFARDGAAQRRRRACRGHPRRSGSGAGVAVGAASRLAAE